MAQDAPDSARLPWLLSVETDTLTPAGIVPFFGQHVELGPDAVARQALDQGGSERRMLPCGKKRLHRLQQRLGFGARCWVRVAVHILPNGPVRISQRVSYAPYPYSANHLSPAFRLHGDDDSTESPNCQRIFFID